jgi:tetratricopeptide (TPR) repeat protein
MDIKAGTYGLFLEVTKEGPWTWIFSKDANNWGPYHYKPEHDALRVTSTPKDAPYTEWLTFNFDERLLTSTIAYFQWENKRADFKVELPNFYDLYVDKIRGELKGKVMGFSNQQWMDAANFCADHKVNLDEALQWADYSINGRYFGHEDFNSLQTKAHVLTAMGKDSEAEQLMAKAINLPSTTVQSIHQYARSLLAAGQNEKALAIFKLNQQKFPKEKFTTSVGLARGYTAVGDKKNAIKFWEIALKNLPADQQPAKEFYVAELNKLKG